MSTTNFENGTIIASAWLNDVDAVTYEGTFPDGTHVQTVEGLATTAGSHGIGHIAAAATSTATTVQAKLRESLSVKDFGAVGDGTTDDTAAIAKALSAGKQRTVLFPAGTYKISTTLTVRSGTRLQGEGPGSTTIKLSSTFPSGTTVFLNETLTGAVDAYYDSEIEFAGLRFDGNSNASRTTEMISLVKVQNCSVEDCEFINHTFICIAINASQNVRVVRNMFKGNGRPKPSTLSTPCVWTGSGALGTPKDIQVDHNTFLGNNWSCCYFMPFGGSFSFNYCVGNGESGVFTNSQGQYLRYIGNHIEGQVRSNISASGIEVGGMYLLIANNLIVGCGNDGVSLTDVENVVVSNNQIFNNGQESSRYPSASGVSIITYASPNPDHIRIHGNRIGDRQGTKTQAYGVGVFGTAGALERVVIHDNDFTEQKISAYQIPPAIWTTASCFLYNNYLADGTFEAGSSGGGGTGTGTVTSVSADGGATGLTVSGSPITTTGTLTMGGVLNIAHGGTGATSLAAAGITTLSDNQVISGSKAFTNPNSQFLGRTYATSDGGSGINAYFAEDTAYALIGGTNGVVLASGSPYPGTARVAADSVSFRPIANGAYSLGTTVQRWSTICSVNMDLSGSVTAGTWQGSAVGLAYGGTGATTAAAARVNLLPSLAGNAGKVLTVNPGATDAIWSSAGGSGTVTSVAASGGTTGMSFSGGPITTSGTLTMSGTLAVANGGTGSTSLAGAGLVTLADSQVISGSKSFTSPTSQFLARTYATSNGSTGQNAYLAENSSYALIGGTNGVAFASGAPYPGTSNFAAEAGTFRPISDNSKSLGSAANRWSVVYAANGAIQTSDGREKQDIAVLSDVELRVAVKLKGLIRKFRFKSAVAEKGDAARIHVGVVAQEVQAAFASEGLDGFQYGVLCYDAWDAVEHEDPIFGREAGDRFGVRYEQLFAFIIACL